ncbi:hypothetical protein CR513_30829, partial [Mucuna pruriens]
MMNNAFVKCRVDPQLLEMLIVVIPKVDQFICLKEFHPISLCNNDSMLDRLKARQPSFASPLYPMYGVIISYDSSPDNFYIWTAEEQMRIFFCFLSRLKFYLDRFISIHSSQVSNSTRTTLSSILSIRNTNSTSKYLGYHLIVNKVTNANFCHILEKTQAYLISWKDKLLNKVDRLCLIEFMLLSIPVYSMQLSIFKALEEKQSRFGPYLNDKTFSLWFFDLLGTITL